MATVLRLVRTSAPAEHAQPETKRPFRLWNPAAKHYLPHRFYSDHRRALNGALLAIKWAHAGDVIEVLDVRTMKWLATYRRGPTSIDLQERRGVVQ